MSTNVLNLWGWSPYYKQNFQKLADQSPELNLQPGRVIAEHKLSYTLITENGELLGEVSGKFRFAATEREHYPAVGDWVAISPRYSDGRATIHAVLPRKSKFSRKAAGLTTDEQIVATNVDTIFLVNALNQDFNMRRLERYLILAWESGANPVIILSKADLVADPSVQIAAAESVAPGVPIFAVSAQNGSGLDALTPFLAPGQTTAFLGSSGVGKSSLLNRLAGRELQEVQEIRADDDKGKHTTTHREIFLLPQGGLLIDTPGMREIQLWESEDGLSEAFSDIEELAAQCRFADCSHKKEPGCAVKRALASGTLDRSRYDSYRKLEAELVFLARKEEQKQRLQEKSARKDYKQGRDAYL
ncbi:ribosome small subunit-dependent GTPase A [Gorillibacterium massiliense]|uniref:ribosome small subunit-dependent GTPase A n=1 Tax=Gorillibacterium massiliense TaxID=1280390 RepID=UPI0004ACB83D